ncbi:MAG TPA: bifunctional 2-polyprenyl-6-hydroxyphenol methylase/3-demethylubiquinol 3-O-methyltransferase UbiG [Steroidobacteraceae bacterium]|nr:bifunctional 2-polyprenyl-6-hydroxyphenol methylase/3-demethylubiquinol 3-O-methyltransferase UbiG [Steroidobacteraceae bacterium]
MSTTPASGGERARRANADHAELGRFERIAARFWDPRGEFRPLHLVNPLRTRFIAARVPLAGSRVLDVGCGGGLLAEALAGAGARVTGIDLAPGMIEVARLHAAESAVSIDYRVVGAEELLAAEPGGFDVVTCMEMLEHVPDPPAIVQACAKLAKPGGLVFFSTINRNAKSFVFAIIGAEYVLRLLPRGTHEYARFIRPSELSRACRDAGLAVFDLTGMTYNPITKAYALGRDVGVNYLLGARRD